MNNKTFISRNSEEFSKMEREMAGEFCITIMVTDIKEIGDKILLMEKVYFTTLMEDGMMEIGSPIKNQDKEPSII